MSELHPHWQATGDERIAASTETSPPREHSASVRVRVGSSSVSRMPAAFVGIVACLALGIAAVGGWGSLRSQITAVNDAMPMADNTIIESVTDDSSVITEELLIILGDDGITGADTLTVRPGDTITFRNDGSIPQILQSTSVGLIDEDEQALDLTIFPGDEVTFTIATTIVPGPYAYASITSTITGTIIVDPASGVGNRAGGSVFGSLDGISFFDGGDNSAGTQTATSTPSTVALTPPQEDITLFPAAPTTSLTTDVPPVEPAIADVPETLPLSTSPSPFAGTNPADLLPVNPYSVDVIGSQTPPLLADETLGEELHPAAQPASGPELWVAYVLSVLLLFWMIRRSLTSIA